MKYYHKNFNHTVWTKLQRWKLFFAPASSASCGPSSRSGGVGVRVGGVKVGGVRGGGGGKTLLIGTE